MKDSKNSGPPSLEVKSRVKATYHLTMLPLLFKSGGDHTFPHVAECHITSVKWQLGANREQADN